MITPAPTVNPLVAECNDGWLNDLQAFAPIAAEIAGILHQGMSFRESVLTFSLSILGSLSHTIELRYPFLSGHFRRVRDLSVRVGERIGMNGADLESLRTAAELHDVGIVGIPGNLLAKKRRLSEQETEMVRKHPFLGAKMLEGVSHLRAAIPFARNHHEKWNGTGYPDRLAGTDIPVGGRLLALVDVFDALTTDRPARRMSAANSSSRRPGQPG